MNTKKRKVPAFLHPLLEALSTFSLRLHLTFLAESLPEQKADKIHYNQAKREQDWQNQQNKLRAKSLKEKAKWIS